MNCALDPIKLGVLTLFTHSVEGLTWLMPTTALAWFHKIPKYGSRGAHIGLPRFRMSRNQNVTHGSLSLEINKVFANAWSQASNVYWTPQYGGASKRIPSF